MADTRDELRDILARGLDRHSLKEQGWTPEAIERAMETTATPSKFALGEVDAILDILSAAGLALVPVEATEAQWEAMNIRDEAMPAASLWEIYQIGVAEGDLLKGAKK